MRVAPLRWTVAAIGCAMLACSGGEELAGPTDPGLHLTVLSGDGQVGKAGQILPQAFLLRATNRRDEPVADLEVTWTVTSGEGVLNGQWEKCESGSGLGNPVRSVSTRTDPEGLARATFMPTYFGPITVTAQARRAPDATVTFRTDATDAGATVAVVSGSDRDVFAGEVARNEREALVVRLTDGEGNRVPGVAVGWDVADGRGELVPPPGCSESASHAVITRTQWDNDARGEAAIEFSPRWPGVSTVTASVPGLPGATIAFTLQADALAIGLVESHDPWTGEDFAQFLGVDQLSSVSWTIGGPVEFWNRLPAAHIVSISTPRGGAPFDSGPLSEGQSFRFVPDAPGIWEFMDQVSGATGTLATAVIIELVCMDWVDCFPTPDPIPPGMGVEFWNAQPAAHLISTSVPSGGTSFDSGPLGEGEVFGFVPEVTGTWEYVDRISGLTGRFSVR